MPVTVIVGGQFGSEGKGKVSYEFARTQGATISIRVGGANSGHTVVDPEGRVHVFRHLPVASLLPDVVSVMAPGSYIDADVLASEIKRYSVPKERLLISPNAVLISGHHKELEAQSGLRGRIGSTASGTGAAVIGRILRDGPLEFAEHDERLRPFVADTQSFLRSALRRNERIILEGTQGYGLSLLHSNYWPNVTSRDTTAAGFVSEAGLSPLDVDDVVLVIRAFPIRVAGSSGPLPKEVSWDHISSLHGRNVVEHTTVTRQIRRVAEFDFCVVRAAIACNRPTKIVLNHLDYIDAYGAIFSPRQKAFVSEVQHAVEETISHFGFSPRSLVDAAKIATE